MYLEIITPEEKLFDGEVSLIGLPGSKGAFEILENHAPLISTLEAGTVRVIDASGSETSYEIRKGVVECLDNKVSVLVESA